jgi:hypothetical protein
MSAILTAAVVSATVLAVPIMAGAVTGCGGADKSAPTRYTDPTYGFSISIPGDYPKDAKDSSTKPGEYTIVWARDYGPRSDGEPIDTIAVGVQDRGHAMTQAEIDNAIAAMRTDPTTLEDSLGENALVSHTEEMVVGGSPALVIDATRDASDGSFVTARIAYVFKGSRIYVLWLTAVTDDWARNEAGLQAALTSFTAQ